VGSPGLGWSEDKNILVADWYDKFVHCLGWINDEQKLLLISQARMLILISYYEGFGLPPLEAANLGVPTIVSEDSAMAEILQSATMTVDPGDPKMIAASVNKLATDEVLRQGLINGGRVIAEQYSWDKTASKTAAALKIAAGT
jgi:glycosyltransferase involved in cell wall biosynthesis